MPSMVLAARYVVTVATIGDSSMMSSATNCVIREETIASTNISTMESAVPLFQRQALEDMHLLLSYFRFGDIIGLLVGNRITKIYGTQTVNGVSYTQVEIFCFGKYWVLSNVVYCKEEQ